MLTKEEIRLNLLKNPNWQPELTASDDVWELYEEVYNEMVANGEITEEDIDELEDFDSFDKTENDF